MGAGVWAAKEAAPAAAADARGYAASSFQLSLDGVLVGLLKSVDGGAISADVVQEKSLEGAPKKHIAGVRYEDFTVQFLPGTHKLVHTWIADTLGQGSRRERSGDIKSADPLGNVKMVTTFENAVLTEIGFPALDASSKNAGHLTLKFAPELTTVERGRGKIEAKANTKAKKWLVSNFRFELGNLPTKRVTKIDAFTIKQTVVTDEIGEAPSKDPGELAIPNLKVTLSEADVALWDDWFDDFVVKGNSSDDRELSGRIVFLDPTLKVEIGWVKLGNVGIYRLVPEKAVAGSENIRRVIAELYVETMSVKVP
jgi:hypothetical protein